MCITQMSPHIWALKTNNKLAAHKMWVDSHYLTRRQDEHRLRQSNTFRFAGQQVKGGCGVWFQKLGHVERQVYNIINKLYRGLT